MSFFRTAGGLPVLGAPARHGAEQSAVDRRTAFEGLAGQRVAALAGHKGATVDVQRRSAFVPGGGRAVHRKPPGSAVSK
jgi:hypothetical protein